jgi:tryptophan-rich sensory protein
MNQLFPLLLFLVLVVGGGFAIGFVTAPGEWYAGLVKPTFNPPNWLFAPV